MTDFTVLAHGTSSPIVSSTTGTKTDGVINITARMNGSLVVLVSYNSPFTSPTVSTVTGPGNPALLTSLPQKMSFNTTSFVGPGALTYAFTNHYPSV